MVKSVLIKFNLMIILIIFPLFSCIDEVKLKTNNPFRPKINLDSISYILFSKSKIYSIENDNNINLDSNNYNAYILTNIDSIKNIVNKVNNSNSIFIKWASRNYFSIYNIDEEKVLTVFYDSCYFKVNGVVYKSENILID